MWIGALALFLVATPRALGAGYGIAGAFCCSGNAPGAWPRRQPYA